MTLSFQSCVSYRLEVKLIQRKLRGYMKSLFTYILLALCLTAFLGTASSINQWVDYHSKSKATLHMDMRNWLDLKIDVKFLAARIIGQAREHCVYVIGHSKPIRNANQSQLNVSSYYPAQLELTLSKVLLASDDSTKLDKLMIVIS